MWALLTISGAHASSDQGPLLEKTPSDQAEVILITYGPGSTFAQRFGHTVVWLRDPVGGINHFYNLSIAKPGVWGHRFGWQGKIPYYAGLMPAALELPRYTAMNRSIWLQYLALNPDQIRELKRLMDWHLKPENRDHYYDYFNRNCSTRTRNVLDQAIGGQLSHQFSGRQARLGLRTQAMRIMEDHFWLGHAVDLVMGRAVDRPASQWDEMFTPYELMDRLNQAEIVDSNGQSRPLVSQQFELIQGLYPTPPARPDSRIRAFTIGGLLAALLVMVLTYQSAGSRPLSRWAAQTGTTLIYAWLIISGLLGLFLLYMWFFVNVSYTHFNENLLVLSPLALILAFSMIRRRKSARHIRRWLLLWITVSMLAPLMGLVEGAQQNAIYIAAFLPVNLAVGYSIWQRTRDHLT